MFFLERQFFTQMTVERKEDLTGSALGGDKLHDIRDFKIVHCGRLRRLDRCHVTHKKEDILLSSFWDGMFSRGFSS